MTGGRSGARRWGRVANERGTALVIATLSLASVTGAAALAVDAAMVFSARAQAQSAADAAALAGASAFVEADQADPGAVAEARARAVALQNRIRETGIASDEVEVEADVERATVWVRVRRPELSTFFARAIGLATVPVSASAGARANDTSKASCVKPWALVDLDPEPASPAGGPSWHGNGGNGNGSGGGAAKRYAYGQEVVLKGSSSNGESVAWVVPKQEGWSGQCSTAAAAHTPPAYRANICSCNLTAVDLDQVYSRVAGSPGGLRPHTRRGVADLVAQDAGARWDPVRGVVVGSSYPNWRQSPRVVTVPLYDPSISGTGVHLTRFVKVFLEAESSGDVSGRFVNSMRTVQLIE